MTTPRTFDPLVLKFFSVTIQRILLSVAHGYIYSISGEVNVERALALADKFNTRFGCDLTRSQRSRRSNKGLANFKLFFAPHEGSRTLDWVLLKTLGEHPSRDSEAWNAAYEAKTRLRIRGYELLQLDRSRIHREHLAAKGYVVKPRHWTWRLTSEECEGWNARFAQAINHQKAGNGAPTREAVDGLTKLTYAPGVEQQLDKLEWQVRVECERLKLPVPDFAPRFHSRFRKCKTSPLSELVARAQRGEPSWFD